jgi:hypothetical protein
MSTSANINLALPNLFMPCIILPVLNIFLGGLTKNAEQDSQRPNYTAACMVGILGNKSVMAQGLEASRQECYRLLAGADVCLWSSLQARPTHEAIGAGECAIECLSLALETSCGFHAEVRVFESFWGGF